MAKAYCGELVNAVMYDCLQFHGGMGYMSESTIERMARDARVQSRLVAARPRSCWRKWRSGYGLERQRPHSLRFALARHFSSSDARHARHERGHDAPPKSLLYSHSPHSLDRAAYQSSTS